MKDEQMVTILNSGRANEYMLAYMEIAMKNAGFSEDDIIRAEHAMLNDPEFTIRVHAGENPIFKNNEYQAIKIIHKKHAEMEAAKKALESIK